MWPPAGPVGQGGLDSRDPQRGGASQEGGGWLGGFFSRSDSAQPRHSDSSGGGGIAFRDDAFETNFGRKSGPGGGRLDGDAGIGSSLGTAYALDTDE